MEQLPTQAETSISTVKNKRKLSTPCLEAVGLPEGADLKAVDLVGLVDEGTPVTAVTSGEFISAIHDRLAAKL